MDPEKISAILDWQTPRSVKDVQAFFGFYNMIKRIFKGQLGYGPSIDFDESLHLVYGDQKTVSLIRAFPKERQEATLLYDRFDWLLAVPGLFHWRK
jgi:hypothetical protein